MRTMAGWLSGVCATAAVILLPCVAGDWNDPLGWAALAAAVGWAGLFGLLAGREAR